MKQINCSAVLFNMIMTSSEIFFFSRFFQLILFEYNWDVNWKISKFISESLSSHLNREELYAESMPKLVKYKNMKMWARFIWKTIQLY